MIMGDTPAEPPMPPPTPPPPHSPPSVVTLGTTVTAADDVSDYPEARQAEVTQKYAGGAEVDVQTVTLVVTGSVLLEFTVGFDTMGECIIVRQKLLPLLKTASLATDFLEVPVTVPPVSDCTVASPSQPPSPPPPSPSPPPPPPPPASPAPIVSYIIAIAANRDCANMVLGNALRGDMAAMNGNAVDGSLAFLEKRIGIAACLGIPGDVTA